MSTRRYNTYPQWSPDGRWIAFLSADALSKRDLYLIRLDGSDLRRIANDLGAAAPLVVWKPVPEADFAPALLLFLLPPLAGLSLWFLRRRRLG
jgi:Tol biopolymer transport system component